jgi:hypothetical protein
MWPYRSTDIDERTSTFHLAICRATVLASLVMRSWGPHEVAAQVLLDPGRAGVPIVAVHGAQVPWGKVVMDGVPVMSARRLPRMLRRGHSNDDLPRCATMDEHRERSTTVPSERRPGRWSRLLLAGAVLVAGAACESGRVKRPEAATTTPADPMVERYLTDALNLIQQHAFYAGRVDWPAVRAKAGSGPPTPPPRPEPTTPSAGYSPSSATATACCSHQSRPANSRPAAPPAAASACWRCSPSG